MKYLKKFDNHTEYAEYINGEGSFTPLNVSWCVEQNDVHFNKKHNYSADYLKFTAIESGTFKLSGNSVSYSLDSGGTWTTLSNNTDTPTVSAGDTILWKANITPSYGKGVGRFSSTVDLMSKEILYR